MILGILAATVLPKFVNLGQDARIAKVKSMEGTVRTAAEMWRAAMMAADPGCVTKNQNLTRNGVTIYTKYCYPQAGAPFIGPEIEALVDYSGYTLSRPNGSTTLFQVTEAPDPATCALQYVEPVNSGDSPTYTVLSNGC